MKKLLILGLAFIFSGFSAIASVNLEIPAENTVKILSEASQYARISGKIVSTDKDNKSKVIFLNFGSNYETSLTALIYQDAFHSFETQGIFEPAEYFKSKDVIIEGIIRVSNGKPEIIIENPAQIKLDETKVALKKIAFKKK